MLKATKTQQDFLDALYNRYGDLMSVTAHQIANDLGHKQAYETHLTARLYRLAKAGWVRHQETQSTRGTVLRREWSWTDRGALLML